MTYNNDWKPTPQTPEQVDEGLRNAFREAKKAGVMDATPREERGEMFAYEHRNFNDGAWQTFVDSFTGMTTT